MRVSRLMRVVHLTRAARVLRWLFSCVLELLLLACARMRAFCLLLLLMHFLLRHVLHWECICILAEGAIALPVTLSGGVLFAS